MYIIEEMKRTGAAVDHQGYYYRLSSTIEILIMGLMCRMTTLADIHAWADSKHVRPMLAENFGITKIPCYSRFTNLVGMIDAVEPNKIFMKFFCRLVGEVAGKTIAIDGKTICSTANRPVRKLLHTISFGARLSMFCPKPGQNICRLFWSGFLQNTCQEIGSSRFPNRSNGLLKLCISS